MGFDDLLKTVHIIAITTSRFHVDRNASLILTDQVEDHLVKLRAVISGVTLGDLDRVKVVFIELFLSIVMEAG